MKEKKRDAETDRTSENIKFKDVFTVFFKNDQVRSSIIGMLLFYTGNSILIVLGLNYFYFNYGYTAAGTYQFYFTIVYAVGTLLGQFAYPLLVNKLNIDRMKVFKMCSIIAICGYVGLFSYVFLEPVSFFPLLCVFGFIVFFTQSIMNLAIYVFIQDSIEYNEYKFGERRESAIFSLRAFVAKLSATIQQFIMWGALFAGSLYGISNAISEIEQTAINTYGEANLEQVQKYIADNANLITGVEHVELWQRVVYQVGFCIVPMLIMLACLIYLTKTYKITDASHKAMVEAIEARKQEK